MDYDIEIKSNENIKSVLELRTRFFKFHTDKERPKHPRGIEPICLVLNPPKYTDPTNVGGVDTWYVVYYKNYYVKIFRSHSSPIRGPHKATLHLQVYPGGPNKNGKHEWLGTALLAAVFDDEERIRVALRRAIRTRQYFVGDKVEEILIDLNPPEDNRIIATV